MLTALNMADTGGKKEENKAGLVVVQATENAQWGVKKLKVEGSELLPSVRQQYWWKFTSLMR